MKQRTKAGRHSTRVMEKLTCIDRASTMKYQFMFQAGQQLEQPLRMKHAVNVSIDTFLGCSLEFDIAIDIP